MDPLTKEQIKEKKYLIDKLLKVKKNVKENEYDYNKQEKREALIERLRDNTEDMAKKAEFEKVKRRISRSQTEKLDEFKKDDFDYDQLIDLMWKSKVEMQAEADGNKSNKKKLERRHTTDSPKVISPKSGTESVSAYKHQIEELKKTYDKVQMMEELRKKGLSILNEKELKARLFLK